MAKGVMTRQRVYAPRCPMAMQSGRLWHTLIRPRTMTLLLGSGRLTRRTSGVGVEHMWSSPCPWPRATLSRTVRCAASYRALVGAWQAVAPTRWEIWAAALGHFGLC